MKPRLRQRAPRLARSPATGGTSSGATRISFASGPGGSAWPATTPLDPSTKTISPSRSKRIASGSTIAGMFSSRATIAPCESAPPHSRIKAAAFTKSGVQAGSVEGQQST